MAWPPGYPSTRSQWYQQTVGSFLGGNWNWGGQLVLPLDNGDIWFTMHRYGNYDVHESEHYLLLLGRVTDRGIERVSADVRVRTGTADSIEDYPEGTSGYFPHDEWSWDGTNDVNMACTDGTHIYLFQGIRGMWWKLDPSTLQYEFMAGGSGGNASTAPRTLINGVGSSADVSKIGFPHCHDGYIWWSEQSASGLPWVFRRMTTTAPYGIETVWPGHANPSGFTGSYSWYETINPSTGLPNWFNSDSWAHGRTDDNHDGIFYYDGYLYIVGNFADSITDSFAAIRRIDLSGNGDIETLWYAVDNDADFERPFDMTSSYTETPGANSLGNEGYMENRTGSPTYEGIAFDGNAVVMSDGTLITTADHHAWQTGFSNWHGTQILSFDLPGLIEYKETNSKPMRHNRADPYFDTVANGTFLDEGLTYFNTYRRTREWQWRDGGSPLHTHVLVGSLAVNQNYGDRVYYMHPELNLTWPAVWRADNQMMIAQLSRKQAAGYKLVLQFEGRDLKGYAPAHGLSVVPPPEEITLNGL